MSDTSFELGPWVEIHSERCRGGRTSTVAVNRRDGKALLLEPAEREELAGGTCADPDLAEALASGGFLAQFAEPVPAPSGGRIGRFLRTFDINWAGADGHITTVHDRFVRHAWRPVLLVAQMFVALLGIVALIAAVGSDRRLELRPSPWEVPVYLGLSLVAIAVHELGHGLVLAHHSRRVKCVGFRLHLGSPSFYVESVEALLLTRRQRMTQAAAGPWAEWLFTSLVATVLWVAPAGALTPILHRFVVLTAFTIATNLLPFAGLDGSLLFADLIREPNLAADSKDALARLGTGLRPGDRALIAYGVANSIVSVGLLVTAVWFWVILFGGIVTMLAGYGPLGILGATALLAVSFGPALVGMIPVLRRCGPIDRMAFRMERRSRIRLAEQFATSSPFGDLDERALGILAGQLRLRRVRRGLPLHEPGFKGYIASDGPFDLDRTMSIGGPNITVVVGPGISATTRRWLSPVHLGLLPSSSLALLDPSPTSPAPSATDCLSTRPLGVECC